MQILTLQNVKKEFGDTLLFDKVSFLINDNDRVALIGPNGNGKTTLLKMIIGEEEITSGEIIFAKGAKFGYLSQEVIKDVNHTLYQEVESVFTPLMIKEKELSELEQKLSNDPNNQTLIDEYGKKQTEFSLLGGYDYHYQINMMLSKFGFHKEDLTRVLSSFSGGERTKAAFVKLLLIKPDLLILDEPTNHLDIATIEWLETYLKSYRGALLFVSHDRYFIDALANKIVEIDNHAAEVYKGNYSFYVEEKKIRYQNMLNAYNNQQREIAKLKRFIEFYKPKPRFVSRAKDREKKLEHMKILDKPYENKNKLKLNFHGESLVNKEIIKVDDVTVGYSQPLIEHINFSLFGQNKIAIMGSNGCGKTTLLEAIVSLKHILQGEIRYLRQINIGYIKQHQVDLNPDLTVAEELLKDFPSLGEKGVYNHLGKFNFDYEDANKKIGFLSGGEKMRVVLAKIILENYDVLLLDEPTNHLDMVTRQALTLALKDYQGSIIFVSHDRYFVDELATHILYIDHHKPYFMEGNYLDFKEKEASLFSLSDELEDEKKPVIKAKVVSDKPKSKRSPLKLEELINKTEAEIKKVEEDLFKEENYMDYHKSQALEKKLDALKADLAKLEEEYLS